MTRLLGSVVVLAPFVLAGSCWADPLKEPAYSSQKPRYARVALTEDGAKVLTIVFDESGGMGKGYDTMYVDLNFNGDLTDDNAVKGTLREPQPAAVGCSFPPIQIDVPYNKKVRESEKPWEFTINYTQFTRRRLFGLVKGETRRSFILVGMIKLKDEEGEWTYYLWTPIKPAESLAEASPIVFRGKGTLQVETKPDPKKRGNTGIAAPLTAGARVLSCAKNDGPISAHVDIKNEVGKTVHSEDVSLAKLSFG